MARYPLTRVSLAVALSCTHDPASPGEAPLQPDGSNLAPVATISTPPTNATFSSIRVIEFVGHASDREDGPLPDASLVWRSSLSGAIGSGEVVNRTLPVGQHRITLIATDSKGAIGSVTRTVTVAQ
ncbi:MAG: hypothetical protein ACT4P7_16830 [Gemmatimonadaceae bacterium]